MPISRRVRLCAAVVAPCLAFVFGVPRASAATPDSGTISPTSTHLSYTFPSQPVANATGNVGDHYTCNTGPQDPCDIFTLTISFPADFASTHPNQGIRISGATTSGVSDLDMQLAGENGGVIFDDRSSPPDQPIIEFLPGNNTSRTLQIQGVPSTPTDGGSVTIDLVTFDGPRQILPPPVANGPQPPPVSVPPTSPGEPRYIQATAPAGFGDEVQGEMNIGFNPNTGRFMLLSSLMTMRLTMAEDLADEVEPPLMQPESCPALWEDVSFPTTNATTLDPILSTDRDTGRTYISQLSGSPTGDSITAFTDDDGETWTQGGSTPEGALDHQSIASGPYVAGQGPSPAAAGYPHVIIYCSQSGVVPATTIGCTRSDDGGLTYAAPVVAALDSRDCPTEDHFIHGHIRFIPDGTIYIPVENCDGVQAIMTSEDSGQSYEMRKNPNATPPNGWMHSAIAPSLDGGTLYHCYVNLEGDVRVAVSHDKAMTWTDDLSIASPVNVAQGVFVAAIAGDADRAACGFVGTTTDGNYEAMDFAGVWYAYVATTYDGGKTWRTVIASPGNPVQGVGGICTTGNQCTTDNHRNLLDFNEMTMDERGYPVYAYDDGCLGLCDLDPVNAVTYTAKAAFLRQIGGRGLLSAADHTEPEAPHRACLGGSRTTAASNLHWSAPDSGGSAITSYKIYRGTSLNSLSEIATTTKGLSYADTSADRTTAYYYKIAALNDAGEALKSNALLLEPSNVAPESPCVLPGITLMVDAEGDAQSMQGAYDLQAVYGAEPPDLPGKVVLTIKVKSLSPAPTPNSLWALRFKTPTPPSNGDPYHFVGLSTQGGINRFVYGTSAVQSAQATSVNTYTVVGDIDPASSVNTDGTITLIADKALFGATAVGTILADMTATTRPITNTSGPIAGASQDDIAGGGYQIVGNAICAGAGGVPSGSGVVLGGAFGVPALFVLGGLGALGLRRRRR